MHKDDEGVNVGIIYVGYAELMRILQFMEMTLWSLLALNLKPGMSDSQAFARIEKWDGTTFGDLVRGMKNQPHWPGGMIEDLEQAVLLRNHLAHNFLREFFSAAPSPENFERATEQLLSWNERLETLDSNLEEHARAIGVPSIDELDVALIAEIDALRPRDWPLQRPSQTT